MTKHKEIIITIMISAFVILVGTIGVSIGYQILFRPERIVEAQSSENNDWKLQKDAYEAKVVNPFYAWKEAGTVVEEDGYKKYYDYYNQGGDRYVYMKKIVDLLGIDRNGIYDARVIEYTFDIDSQEAKEYGLSYVLQIKLDERGEELIFVMDNNDIPVSCQYYKEESQAGAIEQTSIVREAIPKDVQQVFKQLDEVYGQENELNNYIADAKWEVYADNTMAAYVGVVGEYNFIFYYDRKNNQFCGFNIGMNARK